MLAQRTRISRGAAECPSALLCVRLAAFHHKMNELRKKDQEMGGTLWLPSPPAMPEAVAESRTMIINKARALGVVVARKAARGACLALQLLLFLHSAAPAPSC